MTYVFGKASGQLCALNSCFWGVKIIHGFDCVDGQCT